MKQLVEELITRHPEIWERLEDGPGLPVLLQGIYFFRRKALMAGLEVLAALPQLGPGQAAALQALVPGELLINAAAELPHRFAAQPDGVLPLLLGAALGERVGEVGDFYRRAPSFLTRVVGLAYEGRLAHLRRLQEGEPLFLLREPDNPHDPEAIGVLNASGDALGYLRKTLAAILAPQMDRGQLLGAKVACLLEEEVVHPDLRLNIQVERLALPKAGLPGAGAGAKVGPAPGAVTPGTAAEAEAGMEPRP